MTPVKKYVEGKVVSGAISGSIKHSSEAGITNQTVIRLTSKAPTDMTLDNFLTFAEEVKSIAEGDARNSGGGNPNA